MVLDTGATTTIIPHKIAAGIGCDPFRAKERIRIITAGGVEYPPVVIVPQVFCLGQHVHSLPVACHDLPPESTVDGLPGLDFLSCVPAFQKFQQAILQLTQE